MFTINVLQKVNHIWNGGNGARIALVAGFILVAVTTPKVEWVHVQLCLKVHSFFFLFLRYLLHHYWTVCKPLQARKKKTTKPKKNPSQQHSELMKNALPVCCVHLAQVGRRSLKKKIIDFFFVSCDSQSAQWTFNQPAVEPSLNLRRINPLNSNVMFFIVLSKWTS